MSTDGGEGTPKLTPETGSAAPLPPQEVGRQMGWVALCGDKVTVSDVPIEDHEAASFLHEREPRWPHEAEPTKRVEYFLEDNAELFKDCADAWQQVAANQAEFNTMELEKRERQSREERRRMEKKFGGMNRNSLLGLTKGNGQRHLQNIRRDHKEVTYSAKKACIGAYYKGVAKDATEAMEEANITGFIADFEHRLLRHSESYTRAYLASDEALSRIGDLLGDDATAKVFLAKIEALASDPGSALTKYPGLVEIAATHVLQAGDTQNHLHQAVVRTAPEPKVHSREYLDRQLSDPDSSKGKEINAITGVIRLMSSIVEQEYNADPENIKSRLAERVSEWPTDLQNGLDAFARLKTHERWIALREVLEPYMRQGRLPLAKGIEHSTQLSPHAGAGGGKRRRAVTLNMGPKDQDHEQVIAPQEITSFGVVGPRIKRDKFSVETVDSLEELYELSSLAEYAREHAEDPTLPDLFKAALEHLVKNPYDRSCVERLKNVEYEVEGDPRNGTRRPYRFKPQSFPAVKKGDIANATRVIFDVVTLEGKRTLLIYGAFHKQQIDGMSKLPSRN